MCYAQFVGNDLEKKGRWHEDAHTLTSEEPSAKTLGQMRTSPSKMRSKERGPADFRTLYRQFFVRPRLEDMLSK